jgi:hypothetical protein
MTSFVITQLLAILVKSVTFFNSRKKFLNDKQLNLFLLFGSLSITLTSLAASFVLKEWLAVVMNLFGLVLDFYNCYVKVREIFKL